MMPPSRRRGIPQPQLASSVTAEITRNINGKAISTAIQLGNL